MILHPVNLTNYIVTVDILVSPQNGAFPYRVHQVNSTHAQRQLSNGAPLSMQHKLKIMLITLNLRVNTLGANI